MLLAAAALVLVMQCAPSDDATVIARATPPAWPISPYNSTWIDGVEYYQPIVLPPQPSVQIEYVNRSDRTIAKIQFGVYVDDRLIAQVTDAGHFSPGVRIAHDLKLSRKLVVPQGVARCEALEITFSDGSVWNYNSTRLKSASSEARWTRNRAAPAPSMTR